MPFQVLVLETGTQIGCVVNEQVGGSVKIGLAHDEHFARGEGILGLNGDLTGQQHGKGCAQKKNGFFHNDIKFCGYSTGKYTFFVPKNKKSS